MSDTDLKTRLLEAIHGEICESSPSECNEYEDGLCWKAVRGVLRVAPTQSTTPEVPDLVILFDGPPAHESGRFIDVDTPHSGVGEWDSRDDGIWTLTIKRDELISHD